MAESATRSFLSKLFNLGLDCALVSPGFLGKPLSMTVIRPIAPDWKCLALPQGFTTGFQPPADANARSSLEVALAVASLSPRAES